MTKEEAKEAIGKIIQFVNEPSRWGILISLSDDESTIYYSHKGVSSCYSSATLDQIEIGKKK